MCGLPSYVSGIASLGHTLLDMVPGGGGGGGGSGGKMIQQHGGGGMVAPAPAPVVNINLDGVRGEIESIKKETDEIKDAIKTQGEQIQDLKVESNYKLCIKA